MQQTCSVVLVNIVSPASYDKMKKQGEPHNHSQRPQGDPQHPTIPTMDETDCSNQYTDRQAHAFGSAVAYNRSSDSLRTRIVGEPKPVELELPEILRRHCVANLIVNGPIGSGHCNGERDNQQKHIQLLHQGFVGFKRFNAPEEKQAENNFTETKNFISIPLSERSRRDPDGDDTAGLNDVQPKTFGFRQHFVRLGARIEPELITTFAGNFSQHLQ